MLAKPVPSSDPEARREANQRYSQTPKGREKARERYKRYLARNGGSRRRNTGDPDGLSTDELAQALLSALR